MGDFFILKYMYNKTIHMKLIKKGELLQVLTEQSITYSTEKINEYINESKNVYEFIFKLFNQFSSKIKNLSLTEIGNNKEEYLLYIKQTEEKIKKVRHKNDIYYNVCENDEKNTSELYNMFIRIDDLCDNFENVIFYFNNICEEVESMFRNLNIIE